MRENDFIEDGIENVTSWGVGEKWKQMRENFLITETVFQHVSTNSRPKKINCVILISWENNKVGSVGRDFFLF